MVEPRFKHRQPELGADNDCAPITAPGYSMTPPWRHKTCPYIINLEHLSLALLASRQLESTITHVDTGLHR